MAGIEKKSDFQKKLLNRFLKYTKIWTTSDSANADAHCPIAISEEPAQIIRTIKIQNAFVLKSSGIVMLLPSSTNGSIGQVAKL